MVSVGPKEGHPVGQYTRTRAWVTADRNFEFFVSKVLV